MGGLVGARARSPVGCPLRVSVRPRGRQARGEAEHDLLPGHVALAHVGRAGDEEPARGGFRRESGERRQPVRKVGAGENAVVEDHVTETIGFDRDAHAASTRARAALGDADPLGESVGPPGQRGRLPYRPFLLDREHSPDLVEDVFGQGRSADRTGGPTRAGSRRFAGHPRPARSVRGSGGAAHWMLPAPGGQTWPKPPKPGTCHAWPSLKTKPLRRRSASSPPQRAQRLWFSQRQ